MEVFDLIEKEESKKCLDMDMVRMAFHLHIDKKMNSDKEETEKSSPIPKGVLLS